MGEHFGLGVEHDVERGQITRKVAGEAFDFSLGNEFVNQPYGAREDRGDAVGEVVAVDGSEHEVAPAEIPHRFRDPHWFEPIHFATRTTGFYVAEVAASRARVAEDHDRGRAGAPTLADIRAERFLAHGMQFARAYFREQLLVILTVRKPDFEPLRFAARLRCV